MQELEQRVLETLLVGIGRGRVARASRIPQNLRRPVAQCLHTPNTYVSGAPQSIDQDRAVTMRTTDYVEMVVLRKLQKQQDEQIHREDPTWGHLLVQLENATHTLAKLESR